MDEVHILTGDPVVTCIAETGMNWEECSPLLEWIADRRPDCLPSSIEGAEGERVNFVSDLFPWRLDHNLDVTDCEILAELAGRKCYDSWGAKAGRKTNADYIKHTQQGEIPHASILYHPKMTFFFAGLSRRVSLEMIRNYVGSDRSQEGSPSQESTRYTHHYGFYICPPRILDQDRVQEFAAFCERTHGDYQEFIDRQIAFHRRDHLGAEPKGLARKRIYEAAAGLLNQQAETSFVWTTNPIAIAKFVRERDHEAADLEIQRFARVWARYCVARWPSLFPQPWMEAYRADPQ